MRTFSGKVEETVCASPPLAEIIEEDIHRSDCTFPDVLYKLRTQNSNVELGLKLCYIGTMKLTPRNACPVCGSKHFRDYRKGSFDPSLIGAEDFKITDSRYGSRWNLSRCRDCGFVFSNPFLPEAEIRNFYQQLEDREYQQESEGRSKNFLKILRRLETISRPGNRMLDIGAASGIFLELAQKQGYEITGIEPSRYLVEEARKRYDIRLFAGTIEGFGTQKKFHLITLLDILEHLPEPGQFIKRVAGLMEKNGVLVIVTPDISSLAAKIFRKRWWHYRIAHLNFFNRKSLSVLLAGHGFEIVKRRRYAWHFSAYYLLSRIFPGLKRKKSLQNILKKVNLKLQLFDSWEIYARKI
jgi:2-polyprenyl-3-methyl-5-hydroxy-6-metoxy-1,4-benzoquinol methylase